MSRIKVIYHGDCNDGFAAAWAAWLTFGSDQIDYISANYGDPPPNVTGDTVYVVDFSYPREQLLEIHDGADSLLVLDHHKTAQAALEGLPYCRFDMTKSGAMLAWEHFFPSIRPNWIINYVQDRDLWTWQLPDSREINAAISSWPRDFEYWNAASGAGEEKAVLEGRAICRYIDQYVDEMCQHARPILIAGYEIPCVNAPYKSISELVGKLAETAPFAVGWFQRGDGKYQYSLRSRGDFDVAILARRFGGGGHARSAGFLLDHPPGSSLSPPDE